jgi:hypothetical protein
MDNHFKKIKVSNIFFRASPSKMIFQLDSVTWGKQMIVLLFVIMLHIAINAQIG